LDFSSDRSHSELPEYLSTAVFAVVVHGFESGSFQVSSGVNRMETAICAYRDKILTTQSWSRDRSNAVVRMNVSWLSYFICHADKHADDSIDLVTVPCSAQPTALHYRGNTYLVFFPCDFLLSPLHDSKKLTRPVNRVQLLHDLDYVW
jgi:hypothetical protein